MISIEKYKKAGKCAVNIFHFSLLSLKEVGLHETDFTLKVQ